MVTVAGIDLGTQSIKVLVYCSASKEIVSVVSSPLTVDQDAFGKAEQTTNAWLDALHLCFDKIPADIKKTIACIGVSGQQHGLVALDEQNQSVYPVKLWCDTTTSSQAEQLTALLGGKESCLSEIGNEFVSGFTAPKVLWLKQNHPDLYHKMRCILLPHDYLNFYLTGEKTTEFGDASGTGMLNIFTRSWSSLALSAIDAERDLMPCLPRLIDYADAAGFLQPSTADALGLQAGIPVSAGGGDNMMAAIGTGNVGAVDDSAQAQSSNVVTVSLGSSGTVYAHSSKPVVDSQGRLAAFCSSTGGWLPLLCTMNCTLSSELVRGFLNVDLTELEAALNRSPVGSEGILCLPFFNGERTPNLPHAKASYLGISGQNFSHDNFLRSTIEGVCLGLRMGLDALREAGIGVDEIRLTGGGSKSAAWRQMLADSCHANVVVPAVDEGAAFGAALQALALLNRENIQHITAEHIHFDEHQACAPNAVHVQHYDELYKTYVQAVTLAGHFY